MDQGNELLFDYYYLAELTLKKIKPLSRIEKLLKDDQIRFLQRKGLRTIVVPRKTITGRTVYETVFSASPRYADMYEKKFRNKCLKVTRESGKLEGFLFGYPSCCVEKFIRQSYIDNDLRKEEREILFHWACPRCRVTPSLLPYYRQVFMETDEWFKHHYPVTQFPSALKRYRKRIQNAAAALLFSAGVAHAGASPDTTHYIPFYGDDNKNGLTTAEEVYLGACLFGNETSHPYAMFYHSIIDTLPEAVRPDRVYKEEVLARGIYSCPECGATMNMGYVRIVNPKRELEIEIPFIALHYMEYGHFTYISSEMSAYRRVDIDLLKRVLFPFDPEHILPAQADSDIDGLTDAEELALPFYMDRVYDSSGNGVPDGAEYAEHLIRLFSKLGERSDGIHSHLEHMKARGVIECKICGRMLNMGSVKITNPENGEIIIVPYMALHYLAHGSFAYNTEREEDRINAIELTRGMKTHTLFIENDSDNDGLTDEEELYFGLDINKIDTSNNGITDARELATLFVDAINNLPEKPQTRGPYVERVQMDGIEICPVCGDEVPMGEINIYNSEVRGTEPFQISEYAFHFLKNGSFESEYLGGKTDTRRIDPVLLSSYLEMSITGVSGQPGHNIPGEYSLEQNYPNPFNPSTTIRYRIPGPGFVSLKIFDLYGREAAVLVEEEKSAGEHEVNFNGVNLSSGVYFYVLESSGRKISKMMILIR